MQIFSIFKFLFRLAFFLAAYVASAQGVTGTWKGTLKAPTTELPIVFHISEDSGAYSSKMDSPSQGATGIPMTKTTYENNELTIVFDQAQIEYKAKLVEGMLKGTFTQAGYEMTLNLTQGEAPKAKPQEPKAPFPYAIEDVYFKNDKAEGIKFAGTLTMPKNVKNPPVAILVSGSGPQNRDEELLGHKPFLVLADHLSRQGIAVLRYDDRGTAESEGEFEGATSFDFADDAEAALTYLKTRTDVDTKKIGFIGHSEGGLIAPIIAARNKDVAFCVLLAGPGVSGKEVLLTQGKKGAELNGTDAKDIEIAMPISAKIYDICANYKGDDSKKEIKALFEQMRDQMTSEKSKAELSDQAISAQVNMITSPWMRAFLGYDPQTSLKKVKCPVLAVNGEKDFQVISKLNLDAIEKGLSHNKDVTIKEFKDLNHLFQTSETGAFAEYAQIEETFSPIALNFVSNWIKERF